MDGIKNGRHYMWLTKRIIPLERKKVRVPKDDLSREEECKGSQEIISLERKSVKAPKR
jgi:hypothetical protein